MTTQTMDPAAAGQTDWSPWARRFGWVLLVGWVALVVSAVVAGERQSSETHGPSVSDDLLGWRVPGWVALAGLVLLVAAAWLLVNGPQPWRATRWAWFWTFGLATPLGIVFYLVLGGPTSLSHPPRPGRERLTGVLAFLLTAVVSGLLGAAWASAN